MWGACCELWETLGRGVKFACVSRGWKSTFFFFFFLIPLFIEVLEVCFWAFLEWLQGLSRAQRYGTIYVMTLGLWNRPKIGGYTFFCVSRNMNALHRLVLRLGIVHACVRRFQFRMMMRCFGGGVGGRRGVSCLLNYCQKTFGCPGCVMLW